MIRLHSIYVMGILFAIENRPQALLCRFMLLLLLFFFSRCYTWNLSRPMKIDCRETEFNSYSSETNTSIAATNPRERRNFDMEKMQKRRDLNFLGVFYFFFSCFILHNFFFFVFHRCDLFCFGRANGMARRLLKE